MVQSIRTKDPYSLEKESTVQTRNSPADQSYGYEAVSNSWVMPAPHNYHVHFRSPSDLRFSIAVHETAKLYDYATAMPNLGGEELIRRPEQAQEYCKAILQKARETNPCFDVNVPLYLEPNTDARTVRAGFNTGAWIAAKLYPRSGTTGSAEGVDFREIRYLAPVFSIMEVLGMKLLIHGEQVYATDGTEIDPWEREGAATDAVSWIRETFPTLPICHEHVSSQALIRLVKSHQQAGFPTGATVAPQYLTWNRTKLLQGGMNPAWYSIPVLKTEADRLALIAFVYDGHAFLGTDSAPHFFSSKAKLCGCAGGVFNEPVSLFVYFQIFRDEGKRRGDLDWFTRFVHFACFLGPKFYGMPCRAGFERSVRIIPEPWTVASHYGRKGPNMIIPMFAGEKIDYRLVPNEL